MTNEEKRLRGREANRIWRERNPELSKKYGRDNQAKLRKRHPERIEANRRKSKYGITEDWFESKQQKQNGCCAICGKPETGTYRGKVKSLAVDHNHKCCPGKKSCGKCVRGLLCEHCNRGIGMFLENAQILEAAIKYLKEYEQWQEHI
jgi:hypothetical protein